MYGLASSAFARHYLRNHGCFLFLWVLRCFTSPRSLQLPYVFRQRSPDITHGYFRGFPIRRSPDRSLFTSSPGLIAGYNVLHRLLVPRHPPIALSSLLSLQRCSRPLCSSQNTGGFGWTNSRPGGDPAGHVKRVARNRPFRTQQRAWARLTHGDFPLPCGLY